MNINRIDPAGQESVGQESVGQEAVTLQPVVLEAVRYDMQTGLVPVVVQDVETGLVLMQAYANREALKRTIGTGQAWFWSRSRQEYWRKGATSGNVMTVHEIRLDCDGDSVLYLVSPKGPACHTGAASCFFRTITPKDQAADVQFVTVAEGNSKPASQRERLGGAEQQFDAQQTDAAQRADAGSQTATGDESILQTLWAVLESRYRERPQGSYTTYLFEHGVDKIAKKVGEEAVEVVIAAKNAMNDAVADTILNAGQKELASESADLLYHLLALWKQAGVTPDDVYRVLNERHV